MTQRQRLKVPYRDRHQAKALGARWDPNARTWYVPADLVNPLFQRWVDTDQEVARHVTLVPIHRCFVMSRWVCCPTCRARTRAYALGMTAFYEGRRRRAHMGCFSMFDIRSMTWVYRSSSVAEQTLVETGFLTRPTMPPRPVMNRCAGCETTLSDAWLHRVGPVGFRPSNQTACQSLRIITDLQVNKLRCQWRSNTPLKAVLRAYCQYRPEDAGMLCGG